MREEAQPPAPSWQWWPRLWSGILSDLPRIPRIPKFQSWAELLSEVTMGRVCTFPPRHPSWRRGEAGLSQLPQQNW